VLQAANPDGSVELRYAITDLGASFGRMGGRLAPHSKWNLADYQAEGFVEKVEGASPEEVEGFSKRVLEKIAELREAVKDRNMLVFDIELIRIDS
jgi:hypothetical protein